MRKFLTAFAAWLALLLPIGANANPLDAGATGMAIEYFTAPTNHAAFRYFMEKTGLARYERWKRDGAIRDYRVLANRFVDSENWNVMVLIAFADPAQAARWREIEGGSPGGIGAKGLALTSAVRTSPIDRFFDRGESGAGSVFLVLPYDYTVSTNEYLKYVAGYIVPQFDGWIAEKVLARYEIFLARYGVARQWSSLLVLEYRDDEALGAREKTIAKVRARLRDDPQWKAINDNKATVRVGRQYILADEMKQRHSRERGNPLK